MKWKKPLSSATRQKYQVATLDFNHSVIQLGGSNATYNKVLVIDLPKADLLDRFQEAAFNAPFRPPGASAFPGVNAPLPEGLARDVTDIVAPLVKKYFNRDLNGMRRNFFGQVCRNPSDPVLKENQYFPHIDEVSSPPRIVAVHYLADDNMTWPFGGGTGFFKHRQTGFQTVDLESCRSKSVLDGPKDR